MINSQLILERLILISEYLEELKVLSSMDKATFLSDKRNSAAAESFLRRTLEAIFDVITKMRSNTLKASNVLNMRATKIVGFNNGKVILKNCLMLPAPSTFAAS